MSKKIIISIIIYFIFAILQSSFIIYFGHLGKYLNLILISIIAWNIFENPKEIFGIVNAFIGGFFLDILSGHFFGFYIIISLSLAIIIKFFLKKYVKIPIS